MVQLHAPASSSSSMLQLQVLALCSSSIFPAPYSNSMLQLHASALCSSSIFQFYALGSTLQLYAPALCSQLQLWLLFQAPVPSSIHQLHMLASAPAPAPLSSSMSQLQLPAPHCSVPCPVLCVFAVLLPREIVISVCCPVTFRFCCLPSPPC